jgi:hypothetical protein
MMQVLRSRCRFKGQDAGSKVMMQVKRSKCRCKSKDEASKGEYA